MAFLEVRVKKEFFVDKYEELQEAGRKKSFVVICTVRDRLIMRHAGLRRLTVVNGRIRPYYGTIFSVYVKRIWS